MLTVPSPGALPLKLYWNEALDLRETLASIQSEQDALAAGYVFEAGQGFIWPDPRPGTLVLKLFRDRATGRTRLTPEPGRDREGSGEEITKAHPPPTTPTPIGFALFFASVAHS